MLGETPLMQVSNQFGWCWMIPKNSEARFINALKYSGSAQGAYWSILSPPFNVYAPCYYLGVCLYAQPLEWGIYCIIFIFCLTAAWRNSTGCPRLGEWWGERSSASTNLLAVFGISHVLFTFCKTSMLQKANVTLGNAILSTQLQARHPVTSL